MSLERRTRLRQVSAKRAKVNAEKPAIRAAVFARDGYRCCLRGVPGAGECFGLPTVHHRLKASQGGLYTLDNLKTACSSHNDRIESDADLAALAHRLGLVILRGD